MSEVVHDDLFKEAAVLSGDITPVTISVTGTIIGGGGSGIRKYAGPYEATPNPHEDVVLETAGKRMTDDVTVRKIPYWETSNTKGLTVYIGGND